MAMSSCLKQSERYTKRKDAAGKSDFEGVLALLMRQTGIRWRAEWGMWQRVALGYGPAGHKLFLLDEAFSADELTKMELHAWYLTFIVG